MKTVLILHGPNLNLTGRREPEIYGFMSLDEINAAIRERVAERGFEPEFLQTNHEGVLIDALHNGWDKVVGAVLNPGALGHYSYALRDAIAAVPYPVVEVHMSNTAAREPFRRESVIAPVCAAQIVGLGWRGYLAAFDALLKVLEKRNESAGAAE